MCGELPAFHDFTGGGYAAAFSREGREVHWLQVIRDPHLSKLIPLTSFAETLLTVSISDMIAICGALSVSKVLKALEKNENAQFVFVDMGFSDNIQED